MSEEDKINEVETEAAETVEPSEGKSKKKRSLKFKILLVVIILVAVIAVAGGSVYLIFHSNPLFCNAVCHDPMDPYVTSFLEGKSINEKQQNLTSELSVTFHKGQQYKGENIVCLTCHSDDGIPEQIKEGFAWVTGSFELPLNMQLAAAEGTGDKYGVTWCLRDGCHTNDKGEPINDIKALQRVTDSKGFTPHAITKPSEIDKMQHEKYWVEGNGGLVDCGTCHQTHEQSVMVCTECHSETGDASAKLAAVPDGWLTFSEKVKQNNQK